MYIDTSNVAGVRFNLSVAAFEALRSLAFAVESRTSTRRTQTQAFKQHAGELRVSRLMSQQLLECCSTTDISLLSNVAKIALR